MPEEGKDMEKDQGQKGGELAKQWESDSLGDQNRDIDRLRAQKRKEQLSAGLSSARRPKQEAATPRTVNGGPGNPDSVVPMNDEMLKPDAQGRFRIVDEQGKVHPLSGKKS